MQTTTKTSFLTVCSLCKVTCRRYKGNACPFTRREATGVASKHESSTCQNVVLGSEKRQIPNQTGTSDLKQAPGPTSLPLIGTLYKYTPYVGEYSIRHQMRTDRRRYKKYGSVVREEMFPGFVIYHVYDPDLIRQVYDKEREYPERFPLPGLKAYREDRQAGNGIALSSGHEWKRLRGASNDLMKPPYLRKFFSSQIEISNDLLSLISTSRNEVNEIPDSMPIFYRYALESVCNVLFGKRFGILEPELDNDSDAMNLIKAVSVAMDSLCLTTFFWPLHKNKKTKAWRELCESSDYIRSIGLKNAQQCKMELETQPDGGTTSYLKTLVSKPQLESQDYLNIVADVIFAGIETTGLVVAYNMYNLARNPEKQELLYQEIQDHVKPGVSLDAAELEKMSYLKAVMKETFRYTPLGVGNARMATKDNMVLGGYNIPKGSLLMLNNLIASELPQYVKEPEKFIPERWLGLNGDKLHPYLVLPFGLGGRSCIGRRLAMQEMRVAVVKLIQKYKIEYHHEEIGFVTRFGNTPDRPIKLRFIER